MCSFILKSCRQSVVYLISYGYAFLSFIFLLLNQRPRIRITFILFLDLSFYIFSLHFFNVDFSNTIKVHVIKYLPQIFYYLFDLVH